MLFNLLFIASSVLSAPEVQGHRGARARFPENTLPAFEYALKIGVDTLELDMNVTKDDVIVVAHDPIINSEICLAAGRRKISKPIAIRSLTLKEVKSFDCGSLKNPKFPKQNPVPETSIPSLQEVLDLVKNFPGESASKVKFNIETKLDPDAEELSPSPARFVELVYQLIKVNKLLDRVILQSFDYRTLTEMKKRDPHVKLSALTDDRMQNLESLARKYEVDIISPRLDLISARKVRKLHSIGVSVLPWTANTTKDWAYLLEIGVDGIITDDPEGLISFLSTAK
jgi:glycerophosphoryl diester phosphodiesterase